MQPRTTTVGPLIAASATKIAASQTVPAAQGIALTGGSGTVVANNIATSQTLAGAGAVTLVAGVAPASTGMFGGGLPYSTVFGTRFHSKIYITSAGNDSGITFTILGRNGFGNVVSEVVTGSNASVAASRGAWSALYSITASGATASTITVGTFQPVTLDTARQIIFTSGGNDTGITFTITGRDLTGNPLSEIVTGASGGIAASVQSFYVISSIVASGATATTLTVGTNGVARSPILSLDPWAQAQSACQAVVTGTVNYTVQTSQDDPNSVANPIAPSAMTWDSNNAGVIGATTSGAFNMAVSPLYISVLLNSGTGSVRLTVAQALSVPY